VAGAIDGESPAWGIVLEEAQVDGFTATAWAQHCGCPRLFGAEKVQAFRAEGVGELLNDCALYLWTKRTTLHETPHSV